MGVRAALSDWYELRPYPGDAKADDFGAILDHVPEFVFVISRRDGRVAMHIRTSGRHLPLLESLGCTEPVPSGSPKLSGYRTSYRYKTARHCALPVGTADAPSPIFRIMGDSVGGGAYVMVWCRRAASHGIMSHYIRRAQRGQPADGLAGLVCGITGGASRPGPAHIRNAKLAAEKAASRRLFACMAVAAADEPADLLAVESSFPAMSLRRASKADAKHVEAVAEGRARRPIFGRSRQPILSGTELRNFVRLPDESDMASVSMNIGKMTSRSGGERVEASDATTIDIERRGDDAKRRDDSKPSKAPASSHSRSYDKRS